MTTPPYRVIEKRSSYGYTNNLHEAGATNVERKARADLAYDTHKNISDLGRRALMTMGRDLFANYSALKNTILEEANLSVGSFLPQFFGAASGKDWAKLTKSWLMDEWLPTCDVRGWPYDGDSYLEMLVISHLRDGDM